MMVTWLAGNADLQPLCAGVAGRAAGHATPRACMSLAPPAPPPPLCSQHQELAQPRRRLVPGLRVRLLRGDGAWRGRGCVRSMLPPPPPPPNARTLPPRPSPPPPHTLAPPCTLQVLLSLLTSLLTTSLDRQMEDPGQRLLVSRAVAIDEIDATLPRRGGERRGDERPPMRGGRGGGGGGAARALGGRGRSALPAGGTAAPKLLPPAHPPPHARTHAPTHLPTHPPTPTRTHALIHAAQASRAPLPTAVPQLPPRPSSGPSQAG